MIVAAAAPMDLQSPGAEPATLRGVRRAVTLLGLVTEPNSAKPYPEVAAQANSAIDFGSTTRAHVGNMAGRSSLRRAR